jgi:Symplekin tight junction protein C terminal
LLFIGSHIPYACYIYFAFNSKIDRIDIEKQDQKAVLDRYLHLSLTLHNKLNFVCIYSIELCLKNKNDFKSDVIKEAIGKLLEDDVPTLPLMRTAIRAAQSFSEMRSYVLNEVVPKMITKEVWSSSPRVWEGVLLATKILIEQKDGELSVKSNDLLLRSVLKLPQKQLQAILTTTTKFKKYLSLLLSELNEEEKEDLLLGNQLSSSKGVKKSSIVEDKLKLIGLR